MTGHFFHLNTILPHLCLPHSKIKILNFRHGKIQYQVTVRGQRSKSIRADSTVSFVEHGKEYSNELKLGKAAGKFLPVKGQDMSIRSRKMSTWGKMPVSCLQYVSFLFSIDNSQR